MRSSSFGFGPSTANWVSWICPATAGQRSSRKERDSWQKLAEGYLAKRKELVLAFLLQDVRRNWSEDESLLLDWLDEREVPGRVVLTKTDKLKLMKRKERVRALLGEIGDGFGKPISTSSQKGDGLDLVWKACLQHALPRPGEAGAEAEEEADA